MNKNLNLIRNFLPFLSKIVIKNEYRSFIVENKSKDEKYFLLEFKDL